MSNYSFDERDATSAATRETMHTPQQHMPPPPAMYGYGQQPGWGPRSQQYGFGRGMGYRGPSETKPFFLTSEFVLSVIVSIGIAITAASSHAFGGWRAWVLIAAIMASYNLSRGIAKAGTRSRAHDPREDLDLHRGREHSHAHDGS